MTTDAHDQGKESAPKAKVFISYSRKDIAFADRLDAALKARSFEPLIDRTDIHAFEEWWKRIEALIGQADTIVFVLSPDAVRPGSVALKEVAFAASLNKRFAPIVFRLVEDKSIPHELAKLNFIFFDDASQFEQSTEKLTEALNTDIGWVRQHTEYGEAERRWSAAGRPRGLLLQSPTLEIAEHWLVSRPRGVAEPTAEIRAFVAASRKGAQSAQRVWRLVLTCTFTFMAVTILGLVGWINQAYLMDQWNWYATMRPYRVANIDPYVLSADIERMLKPGDSFHECATDCPELIIVPAGEFLMGSPPTEANRFSNEGPQHKVTIGYPFAVGKFDVTFAEWDACVSVRGCPSRAASGWGRDKQPVIFVSWDDAKVYAAWLSMMTGKGYRLLTEAEWEYAARAGTTTVYFWGDEIGKGNANCNDCGSRWGGLQPSPVGSFKPNAFGLYDMVGNVFQWVEDCYSNYGGAPTDGSAIGGECDYRVIRGGAWDNAGKDLRSAGRRGTAPDLRSDGLGFRVGRTLLPP
jgi:formylglycine-generating enzyme required for sulfatase activity